MLQALDGRQSLLSRLIAGVAVGVLTLSVAQLCNAASKVGDIERELHRAQDLRAQGRIADAELAYRAILREHPDDQRAYDALAALAASHELPADSAASFAARVRLSDRFSMVQTERFVVYSDVAEQPTMRSAQWIERARQEFVRFATDCDLRPLPLQHKLVCILFGDRDDYLLFAQNQDGMSNVSFTGYYSPRNDRVVLSVEPEWLRTAQNPPAQAGEAAASTKPVLGFDERGEAGAAGAMPAAAGAVNGTVPTHEAPEGSAAKCVHETIHQLMFHTGVMSPDVQYPLWICEGLSTAFETDSPDEPFGPDRDFAPRRRAFESLYRQNALIPLRELATLTQLSANQPRMIRVVYQQSYALVTWLARERKSQLRDYLNLMRTQPAGRISPSRHLAMFEQAFGPVDALEQQWLAHERETMRAKRLSD